MPDESIASPQPTIDTAPLQIQEEPILSTRIDPDLIQTDSNEPLPPAMVAIIDEIQPTIQQDGPTEENNVEAEEPKLRRSLRGRVPIKKWRAWSASVQSDNGRPYIPSNYKDAITCHEVERWKLAIKKEYVSLMENETWSIVACPKGRGPIKSR